MSSKSDYSPEEWSVLVRAPLLAGMSLTLADPGGPIEAAKEALATMRVMTDAGSQAELLLAVSQEAKTMLEARKNPIGDFELDASRAGDHILEELGRVDRILRAKATTEEAAEFRVWLGRAAQAAADAAKEGGFLGFGAVKVSEGEQKMLDQLGAALSGGAAAPPPGTPRIDLELCTGCGICADLCPDVFEMDDDGFSRVLDGYECDDTACCIEAVEHCPEGAISIE